MPALVSCSPTKSLLRTGTKTRRSLGQLLEHIAKCNTWSERVTVSVHLFVIAITEPRHREVKVLIHVIIHGFHGRPRDADLVAADSKCMVPT